LAQRLRARSSWSSGGRRLSHPVVMPHVLSLDAARARATKCRTFTAAMRDLDGAAEVSVLTDLNVTGKPARFGRGVLADASENIIQHFVTSLARQCESGDVGVRPFVSSSENVASLLENGDRKVAVEALAASPKPSAIRVGTGEPPISGGCRSVGHSRWPVDQAGRSSTGVADAGLPDRLAHGPCPSVTACRRLSPLLTATAFRHGGRRSTRRLTLRRVSPRSAGAPCRRGCAWLRLAVPGCAWGAGPRTASRSARLVDETCGTPSAAVAGSTRRRSSPMYRDNAALLSEEAFGPVAPIMTFSAQTKCQLARRGPRTRSA